MTALIGTLASSSRTAQAQELASKPPEVDSVAVRIVTDNQIIKWIPTEERGGLTIERRPGRQFEPRRTTERGPRPSGDYQCTRSPDAATRYGIF